MKIMKRIAAGITSAFCAVTMLCSGMVPFADTQKAVAADTLTTMEGFPTTKELVGQAGKLLGVHYQFGRKGADCYHDSNGNAIQPYSTGKPFRVDSADAIRNGGSIIPGIDCSGLIYWTLQTMGYSTTGFLHNNSVPADTSDWYNVKPGVTPTISYNGRTTKVSYEKMGESTEVIPWNTKADGSELKDGSVIIAKNETGAYDHSWFYIGKFNDRAEVVDFLISCGVDENLITDSTVRDWGNGSKYWRMESNGSEGVVVNNGVDAKGHNTFEVTALEVTQDKGALTFTKLVDVAGTPVAEGRSSSTKFANWDKLTFKVKNNANGQFIEASENKTGDYRATGTNATGSTFKLDDKGKFIIKELDPGDYTITETSDFDALGLRKPAEVTVTVSADAVAAASATMTNEEEFGSLEVTKYITDINGENKKVADSKNAKTVQENARFTVKDSTTNKYPSLKLTSTDKDGTKVYTYQGEDVASATELSLGTNGKFRVEELRLHTYVISETKGGEGFAVSKATVSAVLTKDKETIKKEITNTEEAVELNINKVFALGESGEQVYTKEMFKKCHFYVTDAKGNNIQVKCVDAAKGIYSYSKTSDKPCVVELGTESGVAVIQELPVGKYTVREEVDTVNGTAVFTKDSDKTVNATHTGENTAVFKNGELFGKFKLYKKTKTMHNVSGIQFRIHGVSYGGRPVDITTAETDASGCVAVNGIPYGEYVIDEVADTVLDCYSVVSGQKIVINTPDGPKDSAMSEVVNELFSGVVNIEKNSFAGVPLEGFEFTLYAEENIYEGLEIEENILFKKGEAIETLITDKDGKASSSMILPFGYKYSVKETKAVSPYNADAEPVFFTLIRMEDGSSGYEVYGRTVDTEVSTENTAPTEETTEAATSAKEEDKATEDKVIEAPVTVLKVLSFADSQQKASITIYKVDEDNKEVKLSGAEFDVSAKTDVYVDGVLKYKAGDVITHVVCKDGVAKADGLYSNYTYILTETKAPEGYVLNAESVEIQVDYDAKLEYVEKEVSITNKHQFGKLTVYKVDKNNNERKLSGAEFDVLAKEYMNVSGKEIKTGEVVAHIVTDSNGCAVTELPAGYKYLLRETKAPSGYILSDSLTEVDITYDAKLLYTETTASVSNQRKPEIPKTGTALPILPIVAAGTLGLAAVAGIIFLAKKKRS